MHGRAEPRGSRATRRVAAAAVGALAAAALLAPPAQAAEPRVPAQAAEPRVKVSVDDNFFKPKKVTVDVGDKVTWEWDGLVAHNVVVKKGPQRFRSKIQSEGTFTRTIKRPGVYRIVCTIHPGMTMKLKAVKPAPDAPVTTTPAAT